MKTNNKNLNHLTKRLNLIFWIFVILTIILAFREYQYLNDNSPNSGNWVLSDTNAQSNNYLYEWISYINIVLIVAMGALSFATYSVKRFLKDKRKKGIADEVISTLQGLVDEVSNYFVNIHAY